MKLRQLIIDHKNTLYFIKKTSRYNYIFLYFIWNHVTSVTCVKTKRQCSGSVRVNVFFAFVSLIHVLSNVFHTDIAHNHMSMLWSLECAFHLSCCLFVVSLYFFHEYFPLNPSLCLEGWLNQDYILCMFLIYLNQIDCFNAPDVWLMSGLRACRKETKERFFRD